MTAYVDSQVPNYKNIRGYDSDLQYAITQTYDKVKMA